MALNLSDILKMDIMDGTEVLAGHKGLHRQVTSATVMDAPDGMPWIKGMELLFTSTYPFHKETAHNLNHFIEELARRNVAGLGVKLNRYMKEIPAAMLKAADDLAFPIISIPFEKAWIEYTNPILSEILNDRSIRLIRSEEINRNFTKVLLSNSNLEQICQLLQHYVENPVTIVLNDTVIQIQDPTINNSSALFTSIQQKVEHEKEIMHPGHDVFRIHLKDVPYVVISFQKDVELAGYICIQESHRRFKSGDLDCLLHGKNAISLKTLQISSEQEHRKRYRNDFILRLLYEKIEEENLTEWQRKAWELGIELKERYVVTACKINNKSVELLYRIVDEMSGDPHLPASSLIGLDKKNQIILMKPIHEQDSPKNDNDILHKVFEQLQQIHIHGPFEWAAGISQQQAITDLQEGYHQAVEALYHGIQIAGYGQTQHYMDMGVYRLFSHPAMQPEIVKFVTQWLQPLIDYDHLHEADLIQTLGVFLECDGNYRKTAARMYLHHNTVRYRIQTINRELQCVIQDTKTKLQLQIALLLLPLSK
ncbi:PucR family transcriptional regulator [Paenibacillus eucommiae]|uniref:Purine catabolism regulator n=1 Tax=Paenibacillus eucommiae TaxID=1355755 RepID=A0ABS4IPE7_9BACL|nr:PucR family transcriptional regulator [Paenibacillus eucommiae]MBP1988499.1 purine catabolism regulator [Paenibacillus eucommiae]